MEITENFIQQIIEAVKAGQHTVKIKPGVYRLKPKTPSQPHVTLFQLKDMEIDARGVTLLCTNNSTALDILACTNVTLRGLVIDYDPLPFTQGTIVGFAPDRTWTDVRIHKGYSVPSRYDSSKNSERQAFLWTYDKHTRLLKPGAVNRFVDNIIERGDGVYRLDHGTTQFKDQAALGDYIRIPQKFERATGINIISCTNFSLIDVTLHAAPTHFSIASMHNTDLTFRGVRVVPGPPPAGATEPRLCSTIGDGINFDGTLGKLTIENCELRCTGDDGIAVYAQEGIVLRPGTGNQISVSFITQGHPPLASGSRLRFVTGTDGGVQDAAVVSCVATTMPKADIEAARNRAVKEPYGNVMLASAFDLTLDKPIQAREGDMVKQLGPSFVIRGNRIYNGGSRGIVINSSDGVVENNTINHTYLPGIHMFTDFRSHGYSGPQENVLIRGNQISETCQLRPGNDAWLGAICVGSWEAGAKGFGGHNDGCYTDIRIENNQISKAWGVDMQIHNAKAVTIKGNRFLQSHLLKAPNGAPRPVDNSAVIFLQDVDGVSISGNTISKPGRYTNKKPLICIDVTRLSAAAAFKPLP